MSYTRLHSLIFSAVLISIFCYPSEATTLSPPAAKHSLPAISVIPEPMHVVAGAGSMAVSSETPVVCAMRSSDCVWIATYFADLVRRSRGLSLAVAGENHARTNNAITFRLTHTDTPTESESYRLDVTRDGIVVAAGTRNGLFYGAVTLWQLMTRNEGVAERISVPAVSISDAPRFGWRGMMLDSCRHYQSPAFIKRFIDAMALHKLNVLQWHLTDDQGWRLEIRKYPKLTQIGAWRHPAGAEHNTLYGGYYTQDQVREIVAYAAARNITIVPEIEMPGHASAAIVSYPELASNDDPPKEVPSVWGVLPNLYAPNDKSYAFLKDVLAEVMALFPSRYIHIGGDEAIKDLWNASPTIRAQIQELHLKDANALQSYFIQNIETFLNAHGRQMIGWDEILQGGIADNATITSWHGISGAVAAAMMGHDAILSPAPLLYFDNRQARSAEEPSGRGPVMSLEAVYNFNPAPKVLTSEELSHILGLQGNIWTEYLAREDLVAYAAFPRAAALAERAWSPDEAQDWSNFMDRMVAQYGRYRMLNIPHAESAVRVAVSATPATKRAAQVTLSNQAGYGTLRYTLDGSLPTSHSKLYANPLDLPLNTQLSTAAFAGGRMISAASSVRVDADFLYTRSSNDLRMCNTKEEPLAIEGEAQKDGKRAVFMLDILNPCWIYEKVDLSRVSAFEAVVGRIPYNVEYGHKVNIALLPPSTPEGELEVHQDSCDGPRLAVLPLASVTDPALSVLRGKLPAQSGVHDLCFTFTRKSPNPIWAIDKVRLLLQKP